jgi:hypothetical protein
MSRKAPAKQWIAQRRYSALHESGHVVAYWRVGASIYGATLPNFSGEVTTDRRGRNTIVDGMTEASFFSTIVPIDFYTQELRYLQIKTALLDSICLYAGSYAEARERKFCRMAALITTGADDYKKVNFNLDYIKISPQRRAEAKLFIQQAAAKLTLIDRSAISALANELEKKGMVEFEEIDRILRRATGCVSAHGHIPTWLDELLKNAIKDLMPVT